MVAGNGGAPIYLANGPVGAFAGGNMRCYNHADSPAITLCLGCRRALCEVCAARHEHYCERGYEPSLGAAAIDRPCHHHPSEPSRGMCAACGQPICVQCGGLVDGQLTCPDCRQRDAVTYEFASRAFSPVIGLPRALLVASVAVVGIVVAVAALLFAGAFALPSGVNAQAGASPSVLPARLVERHYADLSAGSYEAAWQQLSPSFQSQVQFAAWANSYAGSRIVPSELEVTSQSSTSATVVGNVTIAGSPAAPTAARGAWALTLIDGEWRLDTASFMSSISSDGAVSAER